jgi:hypothetical protein
MAYGKLFESLYTGSMVGAGLNVFAVWTYVIANAKPPGTIELNPKIMATIFGCSETEVKDAIDYLCKPDGSSRTQDADGRRLIQEGAFLYSVPTWAKYNQLRNEVERRAANREAQQRWRDKHRNADVIKGEQNKPMKMQMQKEMQMQTAPAAAGGSLVQEQNGEGYHSPVAAVNRWAANWAAASDGKAMKAAQEGRP